MLIGMKELQGALKFIPDEFESSLQLFHPISLSFLQFKNFDMMTVFLDYCVQILKYDLCKTTKMDNIDYPITMQRFAGKPWAL